MNTMVSRTKQLLGSFSNDDGVGGDNTLQKNEIIYYFRIS